MPLTAIAVASTLAAGFISFALTAGVRRYALQNDVIDRPNLRSSHSAPTPRGGGLGIVVAAVLVMAGGVAARVCTVRDVVTLSLGLVVLAIVGWMDDRRSVAAAPRLAVQVMVALFTLVMFGGLPSLRVGASVLPLGLFGYALGVVGIVWAVNLFNFMDGIDGLAGSQAVITLGVAAALLFWRGDASLALISAILASASAGFLVWNWPPAKIFMGDVGSGALGYAIAALSIASENHHAVPLLAFGLMSAVFVADATVTLVRRMRRGAKPYEAHRDHAYQRLSRVWGAHLPVTLVAASLTALLAAAAALATVHETWLVPLVAGGYAMIGMLLLLTERRSPM